MKRKILGVILALIMVISVLPATAFAALYTDTTGNSAEQAIDKWSLMGVIQGSDGKFRPNEAIQLGQFAIILDRIMNYKDLQQGESWSNSYGMASTAYYYDAMQKTVAAGVIMVPESGMLVPTATLTGDDLISILNKALGRDLTSKITKINADPTHNFTRAEVVRVLEAEIGRIYDQAKEYSGNVNGTAVINSPDVTLKNMTINGNLIISEGVANGEVKLDAVTVTGKVIVRGGGENSIEILNNSNLGSIIVEKTDSGAVRVYCEDGSRVDIISVDDGADDVIIAGTYNNVLVNCEVDVVIRNADISSLTIDAQSASVLVESGAVTQMEVTADAATASVEINDDAVITKLESAALNLTVYGDGTLTEAIVSGNNTEINTNGTKLTVAQGTQGVSENGNPVEDGDGTVSTGTTVYVTTYDELIAAQNDSSVTVIIICADFGILYDTQITKDLTVASGATLTVSHVLSVTKTLTVLGSVNVTENFLLSTYGGALAGSGSITGGVVWLRNMYFADGTIDNATSSFTNSAPAGASLILGCAETFGSVGLSNAVIAGETVLEVCYDGGTAFEGSNNVVLQNSTNLMTLIVQPGVDLTISSGCVVSVNYFMMFTDAAGANYARATIAPGATLIPNMGFQILDDAILTNDGKINAANCWSVVRGTVINDGRLNYNGDLNINGGTLSNSTSGYAAFYGYLHIREGGTVENDATASAETGFYNGGQIFLIDDYYDAGGTGSTNLRSTFTGTFENNTSQFNYQAKVYSEAGLMAAAAAFNNAESYSTAYDCIAIAAPFELTNDFTMTMKTWNMGLADAKTKGMAMSVDELYLDAGGQSHPLTLTVSSGAVLTVGPANSIWIGGTLVNNGTINITSDADFTGCIQLSPTGALFNNGAINNGGALRANVTYADDGSVSALVTVTGNDVIGNPVDRLASVCSGAGVAAAAADTSVTNIALDGDITLIGDLDINAEVYMNPNTSLTIPAGYKLNLNGNWFGNNGSIYVNGTLIIGNGCGLGNQFMQIYGSLINNGLIFNTTKFSSLYVMGGGSLTNNNQIINNGANGTGCGIVIQSGGTLTNNMFIDSSQGLFDPQEGSTVIDNGTIVK